MNEFKIVPGLPPKDGLQMLRQSRNPNAQDQHIEIVAVNRFGNAPNIDNSVSTAIDGDIRGTEVRHRLAASRHKNKNDRIAFNRFDFYSSPIGKRIQANIRTDRSAAESHMDVAIRATDIVP
ncbi:hypothetical protein UP10_41180 [Bradyrhizobium sp. LTSPM299]|nr:hypothetical protein UP10_41180 [Bradyrhizobium sp. LTSPM299]